jgi:hypothetical protein
MKTTLQFPTYLHLAGFMSVVVNPNIQMDLRTKSLTADFSDKEITTAVASFAAHVVAAITE